MAATRTTLDSGAKLDLYTVHKDEYVMPRQPTLIHAGPGQYLTISGRGVPGDDGFQKALQALYGAAYTMKMTSKFAGRDYKVCGLEGLWWPDAGKRWDESRIMNWTLMIRTPEFIEPADLAAACAKLQKKQAIPEIAAVRLERLEEGDCIQVLHLGPYADEKTTIEAMDAFARENGLTFHGRHHEIYLSDPRRTSPDRLRTILRHPVRRATA